MSWMENFSYTFFLLFIKISKGTLNLVLSEKKKKGGKKKKVPAPTTRSPEKIINGELRFQKRVGNVWSARDALPRARAPDTTGRWPRPGARGPDSLSASGHRSRGSSVSPRAPGQRASGSRFKLRLPLTHPSAGAISGAARGSGWLSTMCVGSGRVSHVDARLGPGGTPSVQR